MSRRASYTRKSKANRGEHKLVWSLRSIMMKRWSLGLNIEVEKGDMEANIMGEMSRDGSMGPSIHW